MGVKTIRQRHRFPQSPMGLPGFSAGIYKGETGYLIPTRDWSGQITGGQVRPREGGGYRWLSGCHLPDTQEMPLQVIPGDPSQPVYFAEGIGAKPWVIHFATGATVVGAAGGNFASSPSQLREVQERTQGQPRVLLPDGDSIYNQHVLNQYLRLVELVPDLQVRWWDQFHKGSDPDETKAWVNGTDIP